MGLTLAQLQAIMPGLGAQAAAFLPHLNNSLTLAGATTRNRVCMYLAIMAAETSGLTRLSENLNYSAEALVATFPRRFTPATATAYARQPEKIANYIYALRGGNGDEKSGDGWRYRGAGGFQLTFKANQGGCAAFFGKKVEDMPAWLTSPEGACMSAGWFWKTRGCNDFADHDDFDGVCDVINIGRKTAAYGDAIGFVNRLSRLQTIKTIIKEWA